MSDSPLVALAPAVEIEEAPFRVWEGAPLLLFMHELSLAEHFLLLNLRASLPGAEAHRIEELNRTVNSLTTAQQLALAMDGIGSFVARGLADWKPGRDPETGMREFVVYFDRFQLGSRLKDANEMRAIRDALRDV